MNIVRLFRIKNEVSRVNRFISKIQYANQDNRIINIQIQGNYAYITARVEMSPF